MRTYFLAVSVLTAVTFGLSGSVWAAESASFIPVELRGASGAYEAVSETPDSSGQEASGASLSVQDQNTMVSMPAENPQILYAKDETLKGGRLDLGRLESRTTLKFRDGEYAFVEIAVSLRLADGNLKSVLTSAEYRPDHAEILDESAVQDLETRFVSEIQAAFQQYEAHYGAAFLEALESLGARYVRSTVAQLPAAVDALLAKSRELEARKDASPSPYPLTQLAGTHGHELTLRKESSSHSEDLEIVRSGSDAAGTWIPRYESKTRFILTDLAADGNSRYLLSAIDYQVSTQPAPGEKLKSVFSLTVTYKNKPPVHYSESFLHESAVEERKFMPKWRSAFVSRASEKLLEQADTNREKVEYALFVSYLEPYLYDLYYDFSPFLIKARMTFVDRSTQREIRRMEKASKR